MEDLRTRAGQLAWESEDVKLKIKIILVLSGVLALSVALNYGVVRAIVFPRFAEIERTEAQKNLQIGRAS